VSVRQASGAPSWALLLVLRLAAEAPHTRAGFMAGAEGAARGERWSVGGDVHALSLLARTCRSLLEGEPHTRRPALTYRAVQSRSVDHQWALPSAPSHPSPPKIAAFIRSSSLNAGADALTGGDGGGAALPTSVLEDQKLLRALEQSTSTHVDSGVDEDTAVAIPAAEPHLAMALCWRSGFKSTLRRCAERCEAAVGALQSEL
jgi:hypothetical protein